MTATKRRPTRAKATVYGDIRPASATGNGTRFRQREPVSEEELSNLIWAAVCDSGKLDLSHTAATEVAELVCDIAARVALARTTQRREVVVAMHNLLAETAPISGDYKHWTCQVCAAEWEGDIDWPGHCCEWTRASDGIRPAAKEGKA
jgi:hypothetical protein